ncbi:MAG TPA: TetR/AcrR family transcriptional regulator [Phycicoccus sp.]|jgi:AcrR family transcriptional regulator|nr:TetR/AcrR family transcriptional regulator [Phycicoccus sp.]HQH07210.1 TetR/AcrR family transcriptional regulator [Phycicoccus sp.]HQK31212.1 TetR/AcrR family transcriptional regulator [Phycicoccus sp.]HQY97460.1 TetR/AcrR family transcriptional regulator [Phycicoccus sp.]HRA46273.1 TetR/AcrR family transcriptional regulator [Phycicoccus sp.]
MSDSALGASDLRTRRSKAALVRAVGELLDSGDTRPSITNVVALAGTSRPTFYQHFGDVAALQRAAAHEELDLVFAQIDPIDLTGPRWEAALQDLMTLVVERIDQRRDFFASVMAGPAAFDVLSDTVAIVADRIIARSPSVAASGSSGSPGSPGSPAAADVSRFLAAGTVWLLLDWVGRAGAEPATESAAEVAFLNTQLLLVGLAFLDAGQTQTLGKALS